LRRDGTKTPRLSLKYEDERAAYGAATAAARRREASVGLQELFWTAVVSKRWRHGAGANQLWKGHDGGDVA